MRREKNENTGNVLAEKMVEGSFLLGILSDAVEAGCITHNPAWRAYKKKGSPKGGQWQMRKRRSVLLRCWKPKAKYEVYYKLILATGMHRGEASGLCWSDIDWQAAGDFTFSETSLN